MAQHNIGTALAQQTASAATRTSAAIAVVGNHGLTIVVTLANKAGTPTFTPFVDGRTASGTWVRLWTASAALAANATTIFQLDENAGPSSTQITEGKVVLLMESIRIGLTYAGNGTTDTFDSLVEYDLT